jgi:antagonist of KipI
LYFERLIVNVWEVIQPGALTTIQDLGRYGYQQYGVSISGAMDKFSLRAANLLVGNDDGAPGLEITVIGPKLRALQPGRIAITGADLSPQINGNPLSMWLSAEVKEGDILSFGSRKNGCRAYLAFGGGGVDAPVAMGSYSTHIGSKLGGFNGRALAKGDLLSIRRPGKGHVRPNPSFSFPKELIPVYGKEWQLRVVPGPQSDYFTLTGIKTFYSGEYVISPYADRMAYRLKGPTIEHKTAADILSDATPPGSVQVPGNGNPIVFLADGPTTGGYSKIAVVISTDQDRLAQACPRDSVLFRKIGIVEAQRISKEEEGRIQELKKAALMDR